MTINDFEKKYNKENINEYLAQVKEQDKKINSFLYLKKDLSKEIGVPIAIKDMISTKGIVTTAGSKILENYIPPYNATVIDKLESNGYFVIGKTNMDEFAMGSSTENSAYFTTKNPKDLSLVPGGSSGGSAAAVSAGFVPVSLGTDTGGSIRQPASFCGVVGFCPSYGAVSRYGVIAMASSFDQVGVFANNIKDTKAVFDTIRGKDEKDATSFDLPSDSVSKSNIIKIGIPENILEGVSEEVKSAFENTVTSLKKDGIEFVQVANTNLQQALAVYYILVPSEVSSNLARFDGVKYGKRENAEDLIELYTKTRTKYLGSEPKRRTIIGTYALSAGYSDKYYKKANILRQQVKDYYTKIFESVDLIMTPTTPTTAFKIGAVQTPIELYLGDIYTTVTKLAGLPAISIPANTNDKLPVGIQFIAGHKKDLQLLQISEKIEQCLQTY
jgi:aspartyl-tRNA(Asn)/glutamyl-tRNA(Gln) amidotransferase subunit A